MGHPHEESQRQELAHFIALILSQRFESEINHEQWYLCCFSIKSSPNGFHFAVTIGSEILTLEEIIRDFAQEKYRD